MRSWMMCCCALGLFGVGCGKASGDATSSPDTGSFELTATKVVRTHDSPMSTLPPKLDYRVRVDLPEPGSSDPAVVTPLAGSAGVFVISGDGAELTTLETSHATQSFGDDYDTWTKIKLDGLAFSAEVSREVSCGDCTYGESLAVSGSIHPDDHAPSIEAVANNSGPTDVVLPWTKFSVKSDEGVNLDELTQRVSISAAEAPAPGIAWTSEPVPEGTESSGIRALSGQLQDLAFFAQPRTLVISVDAGVPDLAGNPSVAADRSFDVLGLGEPQTHLAFSSPTLDVTSWGEAAVVGAGSPACEGDGCLLFGPQTACGWNAGVVARFTLKAGQKLLVKARVLTTNDQDLYGSFFRAETFLPGAAITTTPLVQGEHTLTPLATPIGNLTHATDWETRAIDLPGAGEIGIALRSEYFECGNFQPMQLRGLVVDSIVVE